MIKHIAVTIQQHYGYTFDTRLTSILDTIRIKVFPHEVTQRSVTEEAGIDRRIIFATFQVNYWGFTSGLIRITIY
ncbi:MAG: hypothetical protein AAFR36_06595, partial [Bacteroidota bacterium]